MARKQKVLPEVEEVASGGIPLGTQGQHQESARSGLPEPDQPEKHWWSMSKEPRLAFAEQADQMPVPSASAVSRANRVSRYEAVRALH